jgi:hypothetical protein
LNTGRTDLRETLVQQPNTAETLLVEMSSRAFSAKSGQFEAGSTTTASSFLPRRPPFLFCSSMSMSMTSFRVVSEIAMVPESECRIPTLMVSCAEAPRAPSMVVPATRVPSMVRLVNIIELNSPCHGAPACRVRGQTGARSGPEPRESAKGLRNR